ncbi:hypothetical protein C8J56DRAFT_849178 [Mycena floridula]|nr:hypothetical protein C8J56DRAFT_849178 [Mycena floridula]
MLLESAYILLFSLIHVLGNAVNPSFTPVFSQISGGFAGYDLLSPDDLGFAFDYTSSGKLDHTVWYRPGAGTIYIISPSQTIVFQSGNGIVAGDGAESLADPRDRAFAYDYDSSGRLDHLVLYRPGAQLITIVHRVPGVKSFDPVFTSHGIGTYDLEDTRDTGFAFDYDGSGKMDHLVFMRSGAGILFVLSHNSLGFAAIYKTFTGLEGFDLSSNLDRAIAFDFTSSGRNDHILLYRPGSGMVSVAEKKSDGNFSNVFQVAQAGLAQYNLLSANDTIIPYDFASSGKADSLAMYRPGQGAIFIAQVQNGVFNPVYMVGDSGNGIAGYDLGNTADKAFSYDLESKGTQNAIVLYRPGLGKIAIVHRDPASIPSPSTSVGPPMVNNGIGRWTVTWTLIGGLPLLCGFLAIA